MTEVVWENLAKKVDEKTKISEEIDADMLEHNQDPSAHGQSGEALDVHKKSDPIDHADGSVPGSVLKDGAVTSDKRTLGAQEVETANIKDQNVTEPKLGLEAVENHNIADEAVNPGKTSDLRAVYYQYDSGLSSQDWGDEYVTDFDVTKPAGIYGLAIVTFSGSIKNSDSVAVQATISLREVTTTYVKQRITTGVFPVGAYLPISLSFAKVVTTAEKLYRVYIDVVSAGDEIVRFYGCRHQVSIIRVG